MALYNCHNAFSPNRFLHLWEILLIFNVLNCDDITPTIFPIASIGTHFVFFSYLLKGSHPDRQYLTVPPFHSSVFKSANHFGHSFAFDAPKIWNELPHDVRSATSVASFRKKLKTYLLQKPTQHSLPRHVCISLV